MPDLLLLERGLLFICTPLNSSCSIMHLLHLHLHGGPTVALESHDHTFLKLYQQLSVSLGSLWMIRQKVNEARFTLHNKVTCRTCVTSDMVSNTGLQSTDQLLGHEISTSFGHNNSESSATSGRTKLVFSPCMPCRMLKDYDKRCMVHPSHHLVDGGSVHCLFGILLIKVK